MLCQGENDNIMGYYVMEKGQCQGEWDSIVSVKRDIVLEEVEHYCIRAGKMGLCVRRKGQYCVRRNGHCVWGKIALL